LYILLPDAWQQPSSVGFRTASDKQDIEQINHKSEIINHKFIKNGVLLIERNGKTYNAHGAPIE